MVLRVATTLVRFWVITMFEPRSLRSSVSRTFYRCPYILVFWELCLIENSCFLAMWVFGVFWYFGIERAHRTCMQDIY